MTAAFSQAAYVATIVAGAMARGISDPTELSRIEADARVFWSDRLNASYSGQPSGSSQPN